MTGWFALWCQPCYLWATICLQHLGIIMLELRIFFSSCISKKTVGLSQRACFNEWAYFWYFVHALQVEVFILNCPFQSKKHISSINTFLPLSVIWYACWYCFSSGLPRPTISEVLETEKVIEWRASFLAMSTHSLYDPLHKM